LYLPHVVYNLLLVPFGLFQSIYYLLRIKPDLIISFGGYLSVPVVVAGYFMGIRSVLHEQTATIGLANEISSFFVKKIFTAWPLDFYTDQKLSIMKKMEYTGLPVRNAISFGSGKMNFGDKRMEKTIYITGGKSGSLFINKIFLEILGEVSSKYNLIWSSGRRIGEADYKSIKEAVKKLPGEYRGNIIVKEYFLEDEIGKVFNTADMVVTRGGAHTMYELALIKKPAIVIPIPWVSRQEQLKNARVLEKFGLGEVLIQNELTPYKLLAELESFSKKVDNIEEISKDKEYVLVNGQERLGNAIMEFFKS
jgi:UDP-N-acetylglucosamine--N-acetylmuramyl-(pentapeptide) pyrophosphoryl-undecaprenol N-acetylglucosamine transferase